MKSKAKPIKARGALKTHKPSRLKEGGGTEGFEAEKIESTAPIYPDFIHPEFSAELQYEGYPEIADYDNTVLRSNIDEKSVFPFMRSKSRIEKG